MNYKPMMKNLIQMLMLLMLTQTPKDAWACGTDKLQIFVAAAQMLEPQSEQLGSKLLLCPNEAAIAAHWLSFYRFMQPATHQAKIVYADTRNNLADPVGSTIVRAYAGSYQALREKLDSGDPAYKETPEASLALARMLTKAKQFKLARRYYEDTLRLHDQSETLIEYLYTYIWEGDLEHAQQEFRSVADERDLAAALERGRLTTSKLLQEKAAKGINPGRQSTAPWLSADLTALAIKNQYRRYGNRIQYFGPIDLSWDHHVIHSQVYDQATLNSDELHLDYRQSFFDNLMIFASIHYVVHARRHWGGNSELRWQPSNAPGLGLGLQRHHLYADLPLPQNALGITRDTKWAELTWGRTIAIRSSQYRESDDRDYSDHQFKLRHSLRHRLDLLALAGAESRPRPSLYYASYRQTQSLGLGLSQTQTISSRGDIQIEALYTLKIRQPFGDVRYLRHSGVDAQGILSTAINQQTKLCVQIRYIGEETDRPTDKVEQRLGASLGVQFSR